VRGFKDDGYLLTEVGKQPTRGPPMTDATPGRADRVASLDIVRGAVMVLMAIDHVRVYSGLPPGGPTPGIFF
jgi:uncharacterized membrane protein